MSANNRTIELFDTHCHIHFDSYGLDADEVIDSARQAGVTRLMCVGCPLEDSVQAIEMAERHENIWASIGLHPHEGSQYVNDDLALQKFRELVKSPKVVAIGETGLDYYYNHSPIDDQKKLLRFQLDLAKEYDKTLIFHVREAFDDFWEIFDEYKGLRGVIHSFTANQKELTRAVERGLYIGLNGIVTFAKNIEKINAAKAVPIENLILETDAPFLTPVPMRGAICAPEHVRLTAEFLAELRGETFEILAETTTNNAMKLFGITKDK